MKHWEEVVGALREKGLEVVNATYDGTLRVTVPSWRKDDLETLLKLYGRVTAIVVESMPGTTTVSVHL